MGTGPKELNWDRGVAMSSWTGVTLASDRVTEIDLIGARLAGSIPAALGSLSALTLLRLDDNSLTGSIPPELGNLSSLTQLWLDGNSLTGSIPTELGNLSNLTWIDLGSNSLTGSIPTELGNLSGLTLVALDDNGLTGSIPTELGNLSSLTELWLENNSLTGSIPPELGDLSSLTELRLRQNSLEGCIPPPLQGFTGTINPQKNGVNLPTCMLAPTFGGATVANQSYVVGTAITTLTLPAASSGNGDLAYMLSPDPPAGLTFDAAQRTLQGTPTALQDATTYTYTVTDSDARHDRGRRGHPPVHDRGDDLRLPGFGGGGGASVMSGGLVDDCEALLASEATLVGTGRALNWDTGLWIDYWRGVTLRNSRVQAISLYNSGVAGSIPPALGSVSGLTRLRISNTRVSGSIPAELGNLSNLTVLWLSYNSLTGSIPAELGNLSKLTELRLQENGLTGSIPAELGDLSRLTRLYLFRNSLTGSIPEELGNLSRATSFLLHQNSLTGSIPATLGELPNLASLYLWSNSLSGCLPPGLQSVNRLLINPQLRGVRLRECIASTRVSLSVSPASLAEDGGGQTVTVTATLNEDPLLPASSTAVTVVVGAPGDGATEGMDYEAVSDLTVTIPGGLEEGERDVHADPGERRPDRG